MAFRALAMAFLLFSLGVNAQGRKPAVEDFVGIEVAEPESTLPGTAPLFNLEQDLKEHQKVKKNPIKLETVKVAEKPWSPISILGLTLILGLPLFIWFMAMSHFRKKASLENASNIAVLEKYRKEKEEKRKAQESIRKAS